MSKLLIRNGGSYRRLALQEGSGQPSEERVADKDLMDLIAQGDEDAFDAMYLRYKAQLGRFIRGFVFDEAGAEDLLQEVFLRVYRNADKYEPTHTFSSWLYRIATNLCLNELRRRRTHPVVSLNQEVHFAVTDSENETVELHELIPDSYFTGPSEAVESAETMREITSAMDMLSSAHKEVLTMRLYGELNYEQIAAILKCSPGTVKSRAFYGLRALRDKLGSDRSDD